MTVGGWAILAVILGGSGVGGVISAILAWRTFGTSRDDTRYNQLNSLVTQYREMVDEYRTEAAADEGRIEKLEADCKGLTVQYGELKRTHETCASDLNSAHRKIRILEAKVAELGG